MIRDLRIKKGWTQSELARRAGIRQGVLSYIECGRTKHPRSDTLAAALGVSVDKLIRKAG